MVEQGWSSNAWVWQGLLHATMRYGLSTECSIPGYIHRTRCSLSLSLSLSLTLSLSRTLALSRFSLLDISFRLWLSGVNLPRHWPLASQHATQQTVLMQRLASRFFGRALFTEAHTYTQPHYILTVQSYSHISCLLFLIPSLLIPPLSFSIYLSKTPVQCPSPPLGLPVFLLYPS